MLENLKLIFEYKARLLSPQSLYILLVILVGKQIPIASVNI